MVGQMCGAYMVVGTRLLVLSGSTIYQGAKGHFIPTACTQAASVSIPVLFHHGNRIQMGPRASPGRIPQARGHLPVVSSVEHCRLLL